MIKTAQFEITTVNVDITGMAKGIASVDAVYKKNSLLVEAGMIDHDMTVALHKMVMKGILMQLTPEDKIFSSTEIAEFVSDCCKQFTSQLIIEIINRKETELKK